jgi:outer membrane protein W
MQKTKSMKGGKHMEENREAKNVKGKIWKEGNTFPPTLSLQWHDKKKTKLYLGLINYALCHEHKWGLEL